VSLCCILWTFVRIALFTCSKNFILSFVSPYYSFTIVGDEDLREKEREKERESVTDFVTEFVID
jgi:hypothetical protein